MNQDNGPYRDELPKAGKAAELFARAEQRGSVNGAYYLGLCYLDGIGVKKSSDEARRLFQKAADQGHKKAIQELESLTNKATLN